MATKPFINLYSTLNDALGVEVSPTNNSFIFDGIFLKPNNIYPYIQTTNNTNGVELEDWECILICPCTGDEIDITANFDVKDVFFDNDGTPQISWQLLNIPYDFHSDFVYLKIGQFEQYYYSNPFKLTNDYDNFVSRFDYRDNDDEIMQSIELPIFFKELLNETELTSYHEISTGRTVTAMAKLREFIKYSTKEISNDTANKIVNMFFNYSETYMNLKGVNLYRPIEFEEVGCNFRTLAIYISEIGGTYDPLFVPPLLLPHYSGLHYSTLHYSTTI